MSELQKKFGKERRWVSWKLELRKGKTTKIPYNLSGKKASSTDEKTWHTFSEMKGEKNIGIVFTPDRNLLGIDIDHCLNGTQIEHAEKEKIVQLIIEADTYTEISPSGTGLHLYLSLTAPLSLTANRHENFEAYTSGRYFTVTNNSYKEVKAVRSVTPDQALDLLELLGYPWGKFDAGEEIVKPLSIEQKAIVNHDDLIKKIEKSKGGSKFMALWNGDISAYKDDASAADMGLLSHLAFWTAKDAVEMERLWLSSPLGSREKTKTRADYRKRSIAAAIANCKEVYETKADKIQKENPGLDLLFTVNREKEKVFTQNTENMCRILRHHAEFKDRFRYDTFKNSLEMAVMDPEKKELSWRDLEDNDSVNVQTRIQVLFPCFGKVGKDMIYDAIIKVSKENTIDSASDFIRSLVWDGVDRISTWLSQTYNVEDTPYYRAAGSNWIKGLVKRIIEPGCKFDYVLVLEGEQGIKKSTSLNILGSVFPDQPSWHVETTMSTENKDFFMQFQGKAIIEFSEGETLSRTEVKRMKAIITMQSDKYRPAYGRLSVDFPRRCVFAMTTNQTEYLKDETGNRRWLPVACLGAVNVAWLKENRDQLFAEAYHRVITEKETTWEFPEEETFAMQNARRIQDPNTDLIVDWYLNKLGQKDRDAGVTVHQAYRDAICGGFVNKPLDRFMQMNLADIFKNTIRLEKVRKMQDGVQSSKWIQTEASVQVYEDPTPKTLYDEVF